MTGQIAILPKFVIRSKGQLREIGNSYLKKLNNYFFTYEVAQTGYFEFLEFIFLKPSKTK
jgi:hypothetical protein